MKKFNVSAYAAISFEVAAETAEEASMRIRGWMKNFDIVSDPWHGVTNSGGTIEEITEVEEIK